MIDINFLFEIIYLTILPDKDDFKFCVTVSLTNKKIRNNGDVLRNGNMDKYG